MVEKETHEFSAPDTSFQVLLTGVLIQMGLQISSVGHHHDLTKQINVMFDILNIKAVFWAKTGLIQVDQQFTDNHVIL